MINIFLKSFPEFQRVAFEFGRPDFLDKSGLSTQSASDMFWALSKVVVHQQLSGKVAKVFEDRLLNALGSVTPQNILGIGRESLRALGLSNAKVSALLDLSMQVANNNLKLETFHDMTDDEITSRICMIFGFGPWSAHMFLLFELGRIDVWAPADLGVRKGFQLLYGLDTIPSILEMRSLQTRYSPYSSLATWYFWRVLEMEKPF